MKALINLVKKIWVQLFGAAEETYDKYKDPAKTLKGAIRQIDSELTRLEERYVVTADKVKQADRSINKVKDQLNEQRSKGKRLKESGDTEGAQRVAERIVKLKHWVERHNNSSADIRRHLDVIKEVHEELKFKKEDITLELGLIESSQEIAEFQIDKVRNIDGFGKVDGIEAMIQEAREKVEKTQDHASSLQEAQDTFSEKDEKSTDISEEARQILEEL